MTELIQPKKIYIGLDTFSPIFDEIKQQQHKKISIFIKDENFRCCRRWINKIINFAKRNKISFTINQLNLRSDKVEVSKDTDCLISIGDRWVHNITRLSNLYLAHHICIDYDTIAITGIGAGLKWIFINIDKNAITPQMIFHMLPKRPPSTKDYITIFHDLSLATTCYFARRTHTPFHCLCFYHGFKNMVEYLTSWLDEKMPNNYKQAATADMFLRYCYNNAPLPIRLKKTTEICKHYRQFETIIAVEAIANINKILSHSLELINKETTKIKIDFNVDNLLKQMSVISSYVHQREDYYETIYDVIGNRIKKLMKS